MNRTVSTTSNNSLPIAPAFMRSPPPTLPGMPSRNSIPANRQRLASAATFFIRAAAPHLSRLPSASIPANTPALNRTVSPRTPLSSTRKFDPKPSAVTGRPCSREALTSADKSA